MPFAQLALWRANEVLAGVDDFNPGGLLEGMAEAATVLEAAEAVGLPAVLPPDQADGFRAFLSLMPAGLDAAVLAALRSALERGLRTQLTWQPGYDFELRLWEVSEGSEGALNIHVVSPHPEEPSSS